MPCVLSRSSSSSAGWPAFAACARGDRGAEHDVAQQAGLGLPVVVARPQLVHRERQHVGRPRLVHPLLVQRAHRIGVDDEHRQLGLRGGSAARRDVSRDVTDRRLVDRLAGLIRDLDAHAAFAGVGLAHLRPRLGVI